MDQYKMGRFIAERRKQRNLTQESFLEWYMLRIQQRKQYVSDLDWHCYVQVGFCDTNWIRLLSADELMIKAGERIYGIN